MTDGNQSEELIALRGAERRLRESEERLRLALWATRTVTWEWDVTSSRVTVSGGMETIAGGALDPATYPYPSQLAAVHPDDRETVALAGRRTVEEAADYRVEFRVMARDGSVRWFGQTGRAVEIADDGRVLRIAGVVTEVTERRRLEDELAHLAGHDPLTDLPNRRLLLERLAAALAPTDGPQRSVAVLLLDLDGFKAVNDRLGHEAGDRLLIDVGMRLRAIVPAEGTVARLGGDEFTILLPGANRATAETTAARVIEHLRRPFRLGGGEVVVASSVGIALATENRPQTGRLLQIADAALYRAKLAGKGAYAVLDPAVAGWEGAEGRMPCPPVAPRPEAGDETWRWNVTKVLVLLHKRSDLTWDQFSQHWRDLHRPIAMRIPGLREYTENHGPEQTRLPYGIAELYFDSPEAFHDALATPEGQAALADLGNFVDLERTGMTVVSEVVTWQDPSAA